VEGVLAQRLVRKICANCKEQYMPDDDKLNQLGLTAATASGLAFFRGKGCDLCKNTGYKGRMGIYELLIMNDELREMIVREASLDEYRGACRRSGMRTLRETGMLAVHEGRTTIEEIIRETILDE
jgi:type IV pilus assembly protein PilB